MEKLQEYMSIVPSKGVTLSVELSQTEAAAVLAAYDYGVGVLSKYARQSLDHALATLKQAIWP